MFEAWRGVGFLGMGGEGVKGLYFGVCVEVSFSWGGHCQSFSKSHEKNKGTFNWREKIIIQILESRKLGWNDSYNIVSKTW